MKLTRDVVRDLLPVYLAGEASNDTKALVEDFLSRDADLRAEADEAMAVPGSAFSVGMGEKLEWETLAKTRGLLRRRSMLAGISWGFTLLPLSFGYTPRGLEFAMFRDYPWIALASCVCAIASWAAFLMTCHRLQTTGFVSPVRMATRVVWGLLGAALSTSLVLTVGTLLGRHPNPALTIAVGSAIAVAIGERLNQVATIDDLQRPVSLFSGSNRPK